MVQKGTEVSILSRSLQQTVKELFDKKGVFFHYLTILSYNRKRIKANKGEANQCINGTCVVISCQKLEASETLWTSLKEISNSHFRYRGASIIILFSSLSLPWRCTKLTWLDWLLDALGTELGCVSGISGFCAGGAAVGVASRFVSDEMVSINIRRWELIDRSTSMWVLSPGLMWSISVILSTYLRISSWTSKWPADPW